jgi:Tol biopolymer transport system component
MSARRSISLVLVWVCAFAGALVWVLPAQAQREHEFGFSFGGEGPGNGQLMRPGQLAVNEETGDVYVIDRENARVEIFSSTGAYVGQFNDSAAPQGPFSWPGSNDQLGAEPEGLIAIDNSTDPHDLSKGDVYVVDGIDNEVVDKFSSSGAYIGQVAVPRAKPGEPANTVGIAVDLTGGLWVVNGAGRGVGGKVADRFNDAAPLNEYVSSILLQLPAEGISPDRIWPKGGIALDGEDDLYIGLTKPTALQFSTFPIEFSATGEPLVERLDGEDATGFAVDESSGAVYVDHETGVAAYTPGHLPIERFGAGELEGSEGIAVDSKTGTVYASSATGQKIDAFTAFVVPDVSTGAASDLAETSATVGGVVNPDGLPVTACEFEYGTTSIYGQSEPCSPSPGSGSGPVAVSAELKGLTPLTTYHFRLRVANANGSNVGQDRTFLTPEPVALSEEAVSDVSAMSALFSAQINPGGEDTTYSFEYGTSVAYGASVPAPAGDVGSGTSSVPVSARAEGLLGYTTYHVRLAASNLLGTVYGPDQEFTTQAAGGAFVLPDGRAWELVSPPNKDGAHVFQLGEGNPVGKGGLVEASADGGAISYTASGPLGDNVSGNTSPYANAQVLSRRDAGGWSSEDISPSHTAPGEAGEDEYWFLSSDLSRAIFQPFGAGLYSPEATEETPYIRDLESGSYLPLVSASDVPPGVKFGPPKGGDEDPQAIAVTPDFSHVLFRSPFALTSNAVAATNSADNLYMWSAGRLQLVNELPGHTVNGEGADLGGSDAGSPSKDTRNAFSRDGTYVFFQEIGFPQEVALYARDTVTGQTVEVDAPAPGVSQPPAHKSDFQIASADGSKVFFLDSEPLTLDSKLPPLGHENAGPSDLYVYETATGALKDLTVDPNAGEAAEVREKVVGASEDGSIVYFVAGGKLAEGAQSAQDNLYVESETGSSWSAPRLVAVLSGEDAADLSSGPLRDLSSRVSANGRYLTFMSDVSLTGYDNRDAVSGVPDEEVFLYDEASGRLHCVSCDPTGARPDGIHEPTGEGHIFIDPHSVWGGRWLAGSIPGWTEPSGDNTNHTVAYQSRVLSDEGRMFFDSADALVPQDTNGVEDVYEYEPVGVGGPGGCTMTARSYVAGEGGCVSLVSSGTSGGESEFLDASENGDDVFFLTAARLVGRDLDTAYDVYDAHACSAAVPCVNVPVSPPPCSSGDSCKAAPSPQPAIFGAPASATFSGSGNVVSPPVEPVKAKPKSRPMKCRKGFVRRGGRCVRVRAVRKSAAAGKGRGLSGVGAGKADEKRRAK